MDSPNARFGIMASWVAQRSYEDIRQGAARTRHPPEVAAKIWFGFTRSAGLAVEPEVSHSRRLEEISCRDGARSSKPGQAELFNGANDVRPRLVGNMDEHDNAS